MFEITWVDQKTRKARTIEINDVIYWTVGHRYGVYCNFDWEHHYK